MLSPTKHKNLSSKDAHNAIRLTIMEQFSVQQVFALCNWDSLLEWNCLIFEVVKLCRMKRYPLDSTWEIHISIDSTSLATFKIYVYWVTSVILTSWNNCSLYHCRQWPISRQIEICRIAFARSMHVFFLFNALCWIVSWWKRYMYWGLRWTLGCPWKQLWRYCCCHWNFKFCDP